MPVRHFFIEGKFMGQAIARERRICHLYVQPKGFHFFCPHCGELWAQLPIEGDLQQVLTVSCIKHPPCQYEIPGSLFPVGVHPDGWEDQYLEEMPDAVISREFVVHLAWASVSFRDPIASACRDMLNFLSAHK